ncbi:unnamed protein product, partial [Mesorhabditis belari]|uniref:Peptidase M13 N-terminal domain-containing protein n=1 Tax=Mesorhabditis belari TaxID=2138241 RepID=A0AAF3ENN8_9BILA
MQQQTPGSDPGIHRTHSGIYLKKGHDWPRRDTTSPPVGLVSQEDSIVITATTSRGIDPSQLNMMTRITAKPAYSVPSRDPPSYPPPQIVFPKFEPLEREPRTPISPLSVENLFSDSEEFSPKEPPPKIAPLGSISETEVTTEASSLGDRQRSGEESNIIYDRHLGTAQSPQDLPTPPPEADAPKLNARPHHQHFRNHVHFSHATHTQGPSAHLASDEHQSDLEIEEVELVPDAELNDAEEHDRQNAQNGRPMLAPMLVETLRRTLSKADEFAARRLEYPNGMQYTRQHKPFSTCSLILGILFAIVLIVAIGIFIAWAVTSDGFHNLGKSKDTCSTKACIDTAFRLSSFMDQDVLPCQNFYRYSCGGYHSQNLAKQLTYQEEMEENTLASILDMMNQVNFTEIPPPSRIEVVGREIFDACMNNPQRSFIGGRPFQDLLRNVPCGPIFPDCQNFDEGHFSWERYAGMMDVYAGRYNLIVAGTEIINPMERALRLSFRPPALDGFLGPIKQKLLQTHMHETEFEPLLAVALRQDLLNEMSHQLLRIDPLSGDRHDMLIEVSQLIVQMDNITRQIQPSRTVMSLGEFLNAVPQINMTEFLNGELSGVLSWSTGDPVVIYDFEYFQRFVQIALQNPRRALANYLTVVAGINLRNYLILPGDNATWRNCAQQTQNIDIYSNIYINRRMNNISLPAISAFTQRLRDDFISFHKNPSSISAQTRVLVGYPQKLLDQQYVFPDSLAISLNTTSYFDSMTTVLRAQRRRDFAEVGNLLADDDSSGFYPMTPGVLESRNENALVIPLAALQEPLIIPGSDSPQFSIFATYGITILTLLSKVYWQDQQSNMPLPCFEQEYRTFLSSNFQNIEFSADLMKSLSIADALITAEFSYYRWKDESGLRSEIHLPTLQKMNNWEEFYVTAGTMTCNRDGFLAGSFYESTINTAFSMSEEFSRSFHCKKEQPMYENDCLKPFLQIV